jgi:subtilisin family serine protease
MKTLQYYCGGKLRRIKMTPARMASKAQPRRGVRARTTPLQRAGLELVTTLKAQKKRLRSRFNTLPEARPIVMPTERAETSVIPTETVVIDGGRRAEIRWLERTYGMELVDEGLHGKVLMRSPQNGDDGIVTAIRAARALFQRGKVKAAHPNFLRVIQRPAPGARRRIRQWNLDNSGNPGLVGADVHALAAWTITQGRRDVRVAILDEGVDTLHSYLRSAAVAERDFVDGRAHARPDGDDAHGTACAGIVVARSRRVMGLAPDCSLVAARIAKSNASGYWIFDDFATADAIDWCWDDAEADVLSNSWGGGPPVDVIINAFERARTRGRKGRGSLIAIAAGNSQAPVDFPGNLPKMMTVGASNQWDQRKTRGSRDGEGWWGSNYGRSLDVLAPGVRITTTDIRGSRGYSPTLVTNEFNGTSAATPHVAAVAALMFSVNPTLTADRAREIINETTDPLNASGRWDRFVGHGRLNAYAALRQARRG